MSNSIQVNGSAAVTAGGLSVNSSFSNAVTMTGSNVSADVQNIATGTWQGINTSSLADVRMLVATNVPPVVGQSGSINISSDVSGTPLLAVLSSGDTAVIPWSGSLGVYAQAYITASVLRYIITES